MRKILITSLIALLSSCSVYKVDVQQGNVLEPKQIQKLKIGQSRRQVLFILGEPLLKDPFHKNRWDYIYTFRPGGGSTTRQLLTLYFQGDTLKQIDDSALGKVSLDQDS